VTAIAAACIAVLAFIVSVLMAPILYALPGLVPAALMSTAIVLLPWLSLALSGLLTLLPFGAMKLLLRWLGG